jgi:hypothetical protein
VTDVTLAPAGRGYGSDEVARLRDNPASVLLVLLIASIVSTAIHYTDNAVLIEDYPQPDWLTEGQIYISWVVLTAIGIAGYRLYRAERYLPAHLLLLVYSYTGVSSLGHYLYSGVGELSARQHFHIATDGITGSAILAFVIWSALRQRKLQAVPGSEP